jgi:hypothetical protein
MKRVSLSIVFTLFSFLNLSSIAGVANEITFETPGVEKGIIRISPPKNNKIQVNVKHSGSITDLGNFWIENDVGRSRRFTVAECNEMGRANFDYTEAHLCQESHTMRCCSESGVKNNISPEINVGLKCVIPRGTDEILRYIKPTQQEVLAAAAGFLKPGETSDLAVQEEFYDGTTKQNEKLSSVQIKMPTKKEFAQGRKPQWCYKEKSRQCFDIQKEVKRSWWMPWEVVVSAGGVALATIAASYAFVKALKSHKKITQQKASDDL